MTWPNQVFQWRSRMSATCYGFAGSFEITDGQRHRSKAAIAFGSMVHHIVVADDDITRRNLNSAMPQHWLMLPGEKADDLATRPYLAGIYFREFFVEALHPEFMHADLRQLGAELSARRGKELDVGGLYSRLIRKWVGKANHSTPGHVPFSRTLPARCND